MRIILTITFLVMGFGAVTQPLQNLQLSTGLRFEENKGQIASIDGEVENDILFTMKDKGIILFFRKNGISYQWNKFEKISSSPYEISEATGLPTNENGNLSDLETTDGVILNTYRMDMQWVGSSKNVEVIAEGSSEDYKNYYLAHCADGALGVKNYGKLVYKNIYPYTDIVYYVKDKVLKYDIILHPGANIKDIAVAYDGDKNFELKNGKVKLFTPLGTLEEQEPIAYTIDGKLINVKYKLSRNGNVQFDIDNVERDSEIVIDPGLAWSTYYGGTDEDHGYSTAVDVSGNVFLAGHTASNSSIASLGSHQVVFANGLYDAFIAKFSSTGTLTWATYCGGTSVDYGRSVAVSGNGYSYLAGYTTSNTAIASGGHKNIYGGNTDAFLIRFSPGGSRIWGTYYGGPENDRGYATAVDESGNVYLAGRTSSPATLSNDIATTYSHKEFLSGSNDAFLAKFGASGVRQFGTYYGGLGEEQINSIAIDGVSKVYLAGQSTSVSGIAGVSAYFPGPVIHQFIHAGLTDAFLSQFDGSGVFLWATYYGGPGEDYGYSTAVDGASNVYLTGSTTSDSGIGSAGHQNIFGGGVSDAFLVKFHSTGGQQWGTYYGGLGEDISYSATCDALGNVYLAGQSNSSSSIAYQGYDNSNNGAIDALFVKFDANGIREWASFYGHFFYDIARSIATGSNNIYLAGTTSSPNNLGSSGFQNTYGGGETDAFLAVFSNPPLPPVSSVATNITQISFSANWAASAGSTDYVIDVATDIGFIAHITNSPFSVGNVVTTSITGLTEGTTYYYRVRAANGNLVSENSAVQTVVTTPAIPTTSAATSITQTSFTANWEASVGASGYFLDISTSNVFASFVAGYYNLSVGNVSAYAVNTNLVAGTTYYYRVRASNTGGTSGNSVAQSLLTLPVSPVSLVASSITATSFSANWLAVTSAIGYTMDVTTDPDFTDHITNSPFSVGNVLTTSVIGLTAGTTYYYRVRAESGSGVSGNSESQIVLTLPPNPVSSSASLISHSSFSANWQASTSATSYSIDVTTDAGFTTHITGSPFSVGNVITTSITGLTAETTYYYRVRAVNVNGASGNSDSQTVLTLSTPPATSAATLITQSSFTANWFASAGSTGYFLDISTSSDFSSFVTGYENLSVGNVLATSVVGLTAGTIYYYRVRAESGSGVSGNSESQIALTLPPNPLSSAASSISHSSFSANWQACTSATSYSIDVTTDAAFTTHIAGSPFSTDNVVTINVLNLASGTTYYYRVRAVNVNGASGSSDSQTVLTHSAPPAISTATLITQDSFTANWLASTGSTGYFLDISTSSDFSSFVTGYENLSVGNVTNYVVDTNLSAGNIYYYRVRAWNGSSISENSGSQAVLTLPPNPVSSAASFIGNSSFSANWQASTSAISYSLDVASDEDFSSLVTGSPFSLDNLLTASITNLASGTTYYYRVRAANESGASDNSATQSVLTLPANPVSSAATFITQTSFTANWTTSAGASGYILYIFLADEVSASYFTEYSLDANLTSYNVNENLTPGTVYYFTVKALNSSGLSDYSATQSVLTLPSDPISSAATSITQNSFSANWSSVLSATGYSVDVATDEGFSSLVTGSPFSADNVTTTSITNLASGETHYYRVRALNESGTSNSSNTVAVITLPPLQGQFITFPVIQPKTLGNDPFNLAVTASSGLPVSYSTSTPFKINLIGDQVTLLEAGMATIKASQAGNISFSAATDVSRTFCISPPKPTISISNINSTTLILVSSATQGNQWYKNGVTINGATNKILNVTSTGVYSVESKVETCLSSRSSDYPVIITGDLGNMKLNEKLEISPNPVNDILTIELPDEGDKLIGIFDLAGAPMVEKIETSNNVYQLDVKHYAPAMYLILLSTNKGMYHRKFIKK